MLASILFRSIKEPTLARLPSAPFNRDDGQRDGLNEQNSFPRTRCKRFFDSRAAIASTRLEPFFQLRKSRYALNHYFCAKPSHRSNNLKSVIYFTFIQSPRKGNKKHVPYWFSAASTLARQSKHGSNMRLPLET